MIEQGNNELLGVDGLIRVELCNERTGRVEFREDCHNFLSIQSQKVSKWWQRFMWGAYNPVMVTDAYGNKPHEMPWFPAQHIACWSDASVEAPLTEDKIVGDLIAWASRHPISSPTGKRGNVNIAECSFSDTSVKWVFDWATNAGNGTFQSIGWTRISEVNNGLVPRFPEDDVVTLSPPPTTTGPYGWFWDSVGGQWVTSCFDAALGGGGSRFVTHPALGGTGTVAMTPVTQLYESHGTGNNNAVTSLIRIGTDWVVGAICVNTSGAGQPRLFRYSSSGTTIWASNYISGSSSWNNNSTFTDLTVDGSGNIWILNTSTSKVHCINGSTGAQITANDITPVGGSALKGIAYDASDGNFWLAGTLSGANAVWKINNAGAVIGIPYGVGVASVTSLTPFAGTYAVPSSSPRDQYSLTLNAATASMAGSTFTVSSGRTAIVIGAAYLNFKGSELWHGGSSYISALRGSGTLGTRSRLATPATKNSTQTMKITYQFDFS